MQATRPITRVIEASEFARTHCMRCAAGWTRSREDGTKIIVCLLDREPVLPTMTNCDRYELRDELREKEEG